MIIIIYVTSLDGTQVEPLNSISDDFKMEQATDGTFAVSFTCFVENNPGFDILKSESTITVDGYDFKVKQLSQNIFSKSVVAISTFFDLSKKQRHSELKGVKYITEQLNFALDETGWTYTISSSLATKRIAIPTFGRTNVVALITKICKYYECEYIVLKNNVVHFAEQVGPDNDFQYRYKNNIGSVVLKEDTSNLYTKITGYGANELVVTYTSPNVSIFGELEADAVEDDRFTNESNMLEYIKTKITDVPDLVIESNIPELTERDTGERIWLIYEPLNVELQTRIIKQTKILRNGELITASVIFGNSNIKSSTDLIVEQQAAHNELSVEAVKQQQLYNGVEITKEDGVVVSADNGVVLMLNATEGILLTRDGARKFYVDTSGNVTFDGRLHITNGNGVTTLLEAYLDTHGGRLLINDINGYLNVKLGSEESNWGSNGGGILKLYNDGEHNKLAELAAAGNAGILSLYYNNGALSATLWGGTLQLFDGNQAYAQTMLAPTFGVINNEYIATEPWVASRGYATQSYVHSQGYVTASTVQWMINNALASYTPPSNG